MPLDSVAKRKYEYTLSTDVEMWVATFLDTKLRLEGIINKMKDYQNNPETSVEDIASIQTKLDAAKTLLTNLANSI